MLWSNERIKRMLWRRLWHVKVSSHIRMWKRAHAQTHRSPQMNQFLKTIGAVVLEWRYAIPGATLSRKKMGITYESWLRSLGVVIKMYEENKRMQLNCCAMCRCESPDQTPDSHSFAVCRREIFREEKNRSFNIVLSLLDAIPPFVALITALCALMACGIATSYCCFYMHIISTLITSD